MYLHNSAFFVPKFFIYVHNLLEFIKKYYYWFLFVILEIISLILLFRFNSYQASAWYTSANTIAGRVNGWYSDMVAFIHLKDVNSTLNLQNIYLQKQVSDLRFALDNTNKKFSLNEQAVSDSLIGYRLIPAKVISNSLHKDENYIVINKGLKDGIRTDMGVVGGGGVVGIVFLTGNHCSLILPTINVKSNISCKVRHSNYFGYLQWTGGSTCSANLSDIPRYAHIKKGDYIETSGYSSVFPPGIFVGRVTQVKNAPDGLSLQLKVNLGTDFGNLCDVCVIYNKHKPEIDSLHINLSNFKTSPN